MTSLRETGVEKRLKMSGRSKRIFGLIIAGSMLSVAILAYNMDEIYLANHNNATMYIPSTLLSDSDNSLLLMTTDREGKPLPNEPVDIYQISGNNTELLFRGRSGDDGTVQPVIRPVPANENAEIEIHAGKEKIRKKVVIEDTIKIMLSADKPIYQPGQVVHVRTLAYEGESPRACTRNVTFEVESPAGDTVFRKESEANEFGIAHVDYVLADILPMGYYKISAYVDTESASRSFLVKKYVLPKFKIEMQNLKNWYTVDEDIFSTISCQYFFGKVVKGTVQATASTYYGIWQQVFSTQGALSNGQFSITIPRTNYAVGLPWNSNNGYLALNISVTDEAGHLEEKTMYISISRQPIVITALSDLNLEGVKSVYYVVARYPDGQPVPNATVNFGFDGYGQYTETTQTDGRGVASIEFEYRGQQYLYVRVQKSGLSSSQSFSLKAHEGIKVMASEPRYETGQTATFDVYYSGRATTPLVYYEFVSKGFVLSTGRMNLLDGRASTEVQITPEMIPLCEFRVFKTETNLSIVSDRTMFGVGEIDSLAVDIDVDSASYRPRDDVTIDFSVTENGAGLPVALGVSIVDQAVFEVNSRYEGFENLMFEMDSEFATPQYQICDYIFTNKDMTALPTNTSAEISLSSGKEASMLSTWTDNVEESEALKEETVASFWMMLCLFGIVVFFGLLAMGHKRKTLLAFVVALLLVVPGVLGSLYYMTIGFGGGAAGGIDNVDLEDGRPQGDVNVWAFDAAPERTEGEPSQTITQTENPTIVRQFFPETWYWEPCLITDQYGKASLTLQSPDSITGWKVDATASTVDARFGVGSGNITVFQDFFVEPDIPVSVVRGDEFGLKILVYNYLAVSSNVTVRLEADSWFDLSSPEVQAITVAPNSVASVGFDIVAEVVGWHEVNVLADNGQLADAVVRRIYVEPDGKEVITTYNGQLDDEDIANTNLEFDQQSILFSTEAFVKLEAGMDSVVLEGAEKYIQFVSGCGEQSMSTLAVDILAFDVMEKTSADLDLMKYETMVTQGIQHELTFLMDAKNGIGRGIVWFNSDEDVHPWLTSWGLITFKDAQIAGFSIDDDIITDMQDWLVSQQEQDGSFKFPDWGIYETNNPILKSKKIATTAYIARALIYSGYGPESDAISKAVDYITENYQEAWEDPFTLSLCLLVLSDAGAESSLRSQMANQLDSIKKAENNTYYWASDMSMISDTTYYYYGGCNARVVETTAYAMLALYKQGGYMSTVSGAREYLLAHRSSLGGFFSTQDTVVAFQALRSCAEKDLEQMSIAISVNGQQVQNVIFTEANSHLAIFVDIGDLLNQSVSNTVNLQSTGTGRIYYTVTMSQYLPWSVIGLDRPQELNLSVAYDTTHITVDDTLTAHLSITYAGSAGMLKMVLIDLRAPAGFSFTEEDFASAVESGNISSYELKDRQALLYVTDVLSGSTLRLDYHLKASMPIKGTIQGVKAFDMYDPDLTTEIQPVEIEVVEP